MDPVWKLVVTFCPYCTYVCSGVPTLNVWDQLNQHKDNRTHTKIKNNFWFKLKKSPCQIASIFYRYIDKGNISIHLSKLLKQGYSSRKLQTTFRKCYGRHTYLPCSQIWHSVSHMLKDLFTSCDIWLVPSYMFCIYRDGCHMCGSKCSFFPEHLISLPLGSSRFHPFMIYIYYRIGQS